MFYSKVQNYNAIKYIHSAVLVTLAAIVILVNIVTLQPPLDKFGLQTPPITDLSINCTPTSQYLYTYRFPGTVEGCATSSTNAEPRSCTERELLYSGYSTIPQTKPSVLKKWKGQFGTQYRAYSLCTKRETLPFYMAYQDRSGNCKSGQTVCPDTGRCTPVGSPCPITALYFGSSAPDANYSAFVMMENDYLWINRKGLSRPIISSELGLGNGVCSNKANSMPVGYIPNKLLKKPGLESCTQLDANFVSFDSMPEQEYWVANGLGVQFAVYSPLTTYYVKAFTKSEPLWSVACRNSDFEKWLTPATYKSVIDSAWSVVAFSSLLIAVVLTDVVIQVLMKYEKLCFKKTGGDNLELFQKFWRYKQVAIHVLLVCAKLGLFTVCIVRTATSGTWWRYSGVDFASCSDTFTNTLISKNAKAYEYSYYGAIVCMLLTTGILVFYVAGSVYNFYRSRSKIDAGGVHPAYQPEDDSPNKNANKPAQNQKREGTETGMIGVAQDSYIMENSIENFDIMKEEENNHRQGTASSAQKKAKGLGVRRMSRNLRLEPIRKDTNASDLSGELQNRSNGEDFNGETLDLS